MKSMYGVPPVSYPSSLLPQESGTSFGDGKIHILNYKKARASIVVVKTESLEVLQTILNFYTQMYAVLNPLKTFVN